mmetsp:Transcript_2628/g.7615  ORF Transcript_2628/g.7615 Transcript_2628/m.7615 type:complete len:203 (-) Transcript_2628:14-622(-)
MLAARCVSIEAWGASAARGPSRRAASRRRTATWWRLHNLLTRPRARFRPCRRRRRPGRRGRRAAAGARSGASHAAAPVAGLLGREKRAVLLRPPDDRPGPVGHARRGAAAATSACPARLHGGELRAARRRARGGQGQAEPGRAGYPPAPGGDRRGSLRSHACHAGGRGARSNRRSHDLEQNRSAPESPDRPRVGVGAFPSYF